MNFYDITYEQRTLGRFLAPEEKLEKIKKDNCGAVLAVSNNEPVGIVIYDVSHADSLDVIWIAVEELSEGEGVGGDLLIAMYDKALNSGKKMVRLLMKGELADIENVKAVEDYFYAWGFTQGRYIEDDDEDSNKIEYTYMFWAPADYYEREKERMARAEEFVATEENFDQIEETDLDPIYVDAPTDYLYVRTETYGEQLW
ncbi:MAG: hypothetical protein K6G07_08325 [Lachnospiraceae bacterium]|nr:hypothetical protein [Lachnospiraceae bacterium]